MILDDPQPMRAPAFQGDASDGNGKSAAKVTVKPGNGALSVLLIDPSPLSRSCFLAALEGDTSIVITALSLIGDIKSGLTPAAVPDVVVLAIAGEAISEQQLAKRLEQLRDIFPGVVTMLLGAPESTDHLLYALRAGIAGFITTDLSLASTIRAMHLMRDGLAIFPYALFRNLQKTIGAPSLTTERNRNIVANDQKSQINLTQRQQEVLQSLVEGMSNKAIAFQLGISESTVKVHIRAIMERTGVISRTQIISRFFSDKN